MHTRIGSAEVRRDRSGRSELPAGVSTDHALEQSPAARAIRSSPLLLGPRVVPELPAVSALGGDPGPELVDVHGGVSRPRLRAQVIQTLRSQQPRIARVGGEPQQKLCNGMERQFSLFGIARLFDACGLTSIYIKSPSTMAIGRDMFSV